MTIAPGKKGPSREGAPWERDLGQDLDHLVEAYQVKVLVCLLREHEFEDYGIGPLVEEAQARGMEVRRLPIRDGDVPDDVQAVITLVDAIKTSAENGCNVAIHCIGGLGRTGTIAGCLLVRCGVAPDEAIRLLRQTRQTDAIPETAEQKDFVRHFADHLDESPSDKAASEDLVATLLARRPGGISRAAKAIQDSRGQGDRGLVGKVEAAVAADPAACITFDATGLATVTGAGQRFVGGRFSLRSIGELRAAVPTPTSRPESRRVRLSAIRDQTALTDIGALQAMAGEKVLFQVASQFNCLEAPGPHQVPVSQYLQDPTQGPRAAISAFPGALVRHYAAPTAEGGHFVQSKAHQLDLLAQALPREVGQVRGGYLQLDNIANLAKAAELLTGRFDHIRVGVHDQIQVVLGHNWDGGVRPGQQVAQVLTSTFAGGIYSPGARIKGHTETICRQLLRAAYLGTILAGLVLDKRQVILTMIGGGVLGNPHELIWDSICWAVDQAEGLAPRELDVVLNARESRAPQSADCEKRGGALVDAG
ncbi:MAG TPA: protein-tyrosine phosphatase family protein [Polyangia bacterium]